MIPMPARTLRRLLPSLCLLIFITSMSGCKPDTPAQTSKQSDSSSINTSHEDGGENAKVVFEDTFISFPEYLGFYNAFKVNNTERYLVPYTASSDLLLTCKFHGGPVYLKHYSERYNTTLLIQNMEIDLIMLDPNIVSHSRRFRVNGISLPISDTNITSLRFETGEEIFKVYDSRDNLLFDGKLLSPKDSTKDEVDAFIDRAKSSFEKGIDYVL